MRRWSSKVEDPDTYQFEDCEESAFSGAMVTLIKDAQRIAAGSDHVGVRVLRLILAIAVCLALICCQLFVLFTIKTFVTSPAVRSIRGAYDTFEKTMYHGHVRDSGYGFALGIGGPDGPHFDPSQFNELSGDVKGSVCLIPFSQPSYLSIILFIWTLSVMREFRQCLLLGDWLRQVETTSLLGMVQQGEDMEVIAGMPRFMKGIIVVMVLIPRLLTSLILLWLGCRWLTATLDFTEVLVNAIALEFVIRLNHLIYTQVISDRSKRELQAMKMDMRHMHRGSPNGMNFAGSTFLVVLGTWAWIYVYIVHLQAVIPGYQWDVRAACAPWVAERFNFWRV